MRRRAWGLIDWPGNVYLRTLLAVLPVAVLTSNPAMLDFALWAAAAVVAVNGAAWRLGRRRPASG